MRIDAIYVDAKGNSHSDLHVVGVIYSDSAGAPTDLLATSTAVVVTAHAPRSFVPTPENNIVRKSFNLLPVLDAFLTHQSSEQVRLPFPDAVAINTTLQVRRMD